MERAVQIYAIINFVVIGLSHALRLQTISPERAWVFVPPGILFLILAALLGYHVWRTS